MVIQVFVEICERIEKQSYRNNKKFLTILEIIKQLPLHFDLIENVFRLIRHASQVKLLNSK